MSAYESHAETSASLLREVADEYEQMTDAQRWEHLTAANTHAMLALYEGNQQGVAVMLGYQAQLREALDLDRERLDEAKRASAVLDQPPHGEACEVQPTPCDWIARGDSEGNQVGPAYCSTHDHYGPDPTARSGDSTTAGGSS